MLCRTPASMLWSHSFGSSTRAQSCSACDSVTSQGDIAHCCQHTRGGKRASTKPTRWGPGGVGGALMGVARTLRLIRNPRHNPISRIVSS